MLKFGTAVIGIFPVSGCSPRHERVPGIRIFCSSNRKSDKLQDVI